MANSIGLVDGNIITASVPVAATAGQVLSSNGTTLAWTTPTAGTVTGLTGEVTTTGSGLLNVTLSNLSVINKTLSGLSVTSGSITSADSILTAMGKIQGQINGLSGGSTYKGTWNAATNTPTIVSSVGTGGDYYIVSTAGTTNIDGTASWDVGDWIIFDGTVWQKVDNTDSVTSVNGLTGAVNLTTTNITEGTNLYYTTARARSAISLTTTGTSGASTYVSGVLNVPAYTLSGLGGVPTTTTLSINGTSFDLSANRSWSVGTVTSVNATVPTGFAVGSAVTSSGNIAITFAPGYSLPTNLLQTNWDTAYNLTLGAALTKTDDTNVTLTLGGTPATSLLRATSLTLGWTGQLAVGRGGTGASTLTGILVGNATSAFTGVTGTANQLLRRNASNTAYEFFTHNFPTGSGTAGQVTFWNGTSSISSSVDFTYNDTTKVISVNGVSVSRGTGNIATNTALGASALITNSTGVQNTAVGNEALRLNTTGLQNSAFGYRSSRATTTGAGNSSFGIDTLRVNSIGNYNSAFGTQALDNNTADNNTAIGSQSLLDNTTGTNNTAVGYRAGYAGSLLSNITGSNNIFIGADSLGESTSDSNRTFIGNTSTTSTWLGGNLLVGARTDGGQRLQVTGDTLLKGSGATSASIGLTVQNNGGSNMLQVLNNGYIRLGNLGISSFRIYPSTVASAGDVDLAGEFLTLNSRSTTTETGSASGFVYINGTTATATAGIQNVLAVQKGFAPSSGNASFTVISLSPTINQVTANGVTRGLYVNPTLTTALDFRAVEWSNNIPSVGANSWGLYGAGTAPNYLGGRLLVRTNTDIATYGHAFQVLANASGGIIVSTTNSASAIGIVNSASANKTWDISPNGNDLAINESGVATRMYFVAGGNITVGGITNSGNLLEVLGTFKTTGVNTLSNLGGVGSRMVVADANGVLSTQAIPGGSITGTGVAGQVTYWTGASSQAGNAGFTFSPGNKLFLNNTVVAATNVARGFHITSQLSAFASNDDLVGIDLSPVYTTSGLPANVHTIGIRTASSFTPSQTDIRYTAFSIQPSINQTGTATGITRGIHINPTLTAVVDWRSVEWSNNTGWGIYGAGSAQNLLNGKLTVSPTILAANFTNANTISVLASQVLNIPTGNRGADGNVYSAVTGANYFRFNGATTLFGDSLWSGSVSISNIQFDTTGTITMANSATTGYRPLSVMQLQMQASGANNGTVDKGATLFIQGVYPASLTGTVTFTDYAAVRINDLREWGGTTVVLTNRWGIYQAGADDKNYFAASVGVGVATPNASAKLQVDSTTQGFLPPRMTTTQRNAIVSPAAGLIVYDTDLNVHYGYNGTTWNAFY